MRIFFISLGCDKNLVDTEMMLGQLSQAGHSITDDESNADAVIVNTCSFIHDAKKESIDTLLEMGRLRTEGKIKALVCCGCLAQRYEKEIRDLIPEVDSVVGTMAIDEIVEAVEKAAKGERCSFVKTLESPLVYGKKRLVTTGGHYAYLKIAEGCGKFCTYCAIPKMRGKYKSVPMEALLSEARELAEFGVKELILVAQETTIYGTDLYGEKKLSELIRKLSEIEDISFIRILYCYPEEINDELIDEIRDNPKVCHYLDMPIQSGSDSVLKRMGRKTDVKSLESLIKKLREEIPDIALRTTLISGFPGETRRDFINTCEFVNKMKFDRLGVFTYSKEEDTAAAKMKGQLTEFVKKHRRNTIMKLQQAVSFAKAKEEVGRRLIVMVEGKMSDEDVYVCRTYKDAPNVDGYFFLETKQELMTGDLARVVVTKAKEYDLAGVLENEFTE